MFVKITRINQQGHEKELVVNVEEINFLTQTEDHICYDKPVEFAERINPETGETEKEPVAWETEERFLIAFNNGKHPQFLDRANYEKLKEIVTK